jgi:hypothetical protein
MWPLLCQTYKRQQSATGLSLELRCVQTYSLQLRLARIQQHFMALAEVEAGPSVVLLLIR